MNTSGRFVDTLDPHCSCVVSFNQLTGSIPPLLPQLNHCRRLFVNNNHFQGNLGSLVKDGLGEGDLGESWSATRVPKNFNKTANAIAGTNRAT
jgi:hypothetical protein